MTTGHAGDENAATLTREQKEEVKAALAARPSDSGVPVGFWDVPALDNLVKTRFDVECDAESSLRLLMKFCGVSFKLPEPFDKRRDETMIAARVAEVRARVADLPAEGSRCSPPTRPGWSTRRRPAGCGFRSASGRKSMWTANARRSRFLER